MIRMGVTVFLLLTVFSTLCALFIFGKHFRLWLRAHQGGAGMSFLDLVSMTLTRVDPVIIVENKIRALEAGMSDHDVTIQQLQSHYLAGGNVTLLMDTMIAARRKSAVLTFSEASELDLAGKL
jgi:uncharacterized protein YqfA (UPF0365 family)